jgi:RHS repeat-associated protein
MPEEGDILVASINFDTDVITSLAGQNSTEQGIAKGYASGNLGYIANWWSGEAKVGEFTVTGTSFTPNKLVVARKYYSAGGNRVAMREAGKFSYLLTDHLGSTAVVADTNGVETSEVRYKPWGETRYASGTLPTTYKFTGQREEQSLGLYFYNARYYDPALGRFVQADTVVPAQQGVMGNDRYAYSSGNPVKYIDPSGHDAIPYEQILQQCIDFFNSQGYEIVGNAIDAVNKNIHTNGADMVFKAQNAANVLAVEVKNVVGNVTLSTLGPKDAAGYYGGSIARTYASAQRFANSSVTQLKEESQAIIGAYESGNLQNALYTTASNVSAKAQDVFNQVYTNVGNVAAPAAAATETFFQTAGNFLSSAETLFSGIFFYTPSPLLSDYESSDT